MQETPAVVGDASCGEPVYVSAREAEDQIPKENSYGCNIGGGCEEKMQAKLSRR